MPLLHRHDENCGCTHGPVLELPPEASRAERWLSTLAPILACAVCPACVTTYAKVLSLVGLGFALSETQHVALLVFAIAISLGLSGRRSWIERRIWPIAVSFVGCALLVLGHVLGEVHVLEWSGVAVLLVGGLAERRLAARSRAAHVQLVPGH